MLLYRYNYRPTVVHHLDARCKCLCMAAFSITTLLLPAAYAGFGALAGLSVLLLLVLALAKMPLTLLKTLLPALLVWLPLLILVPAFTHKGTPLAASGWRALLSYEGLGYGIGYGWKFVLLFLLSHLLVATTTISRLTGALYWFLRPLPQPAGAVVSAIIGLTLAQIPALFDAYQQINHAQTARLGNRINNPVKRMSRVMLPLLQNLFTRADELALAMESRCFTYHRTQYHAPITAYDCAVTAFFCLLCGLAVWVGV